MADSSAPVVPVIEMTADEGSVRVEGVVTATEEITVQARMKITRIDASGSVNSSQGRELHLRPGDRVVVASTGLSLGANARLEVALVVEAEGREIARTDRTMTYN